MFPPFKQLNTQKLHISCCATEICVAASRYRKKNVILYSKFESEAPISYRSNGHFIDEIRNRVCDNIQN
jgi:hypothetical protein